MHSQTARSQPLPPTGNAAFTADFGIEGMTCASCVARVEKAIRAVPGVTSANVNLATEKATVAFSGQPDPQAIAAAIEKAGYTTREQTLDLQIEGMTCASCVARIEKALAAVPGVSSATVNLATERAAVRYPAGTVTRAALVAAVRASGYEVVSSAEGARNDEAEDRRAAEIGALGWSLALAATFTVPLFVMEMGSHYVPAIHMWIMDNIGMPANLYIQFVLATVVLFGPGLRFFRKGIPNLLRGTPDMNSLVVLGTTAAWGYSIVSTFLPSVLPAGTASVYYEAAAVIVTLILAGRYLAPDVASRVKAFIGLSGPYDFYPFDVPVSLRTFGAVLDPKGTQPVHLVRPGLPPVLLLTGARDTLVQPRNTVALAARLRETGNSVIETHYPGLGHAGTLLALGAWGRHRGPVLKDTIAFLRAHL